MKSIRTGVIGVGSMGQNHARIYSEISNLVGVSDKDETQGRKIAEKFGVQYFASHKEMIGKIDAGTVAVPTILHKNISKDLLSNGIHTLVEKPLSNNTKDALEIIDLARASSVVLAVGHVERFNPTVGEARNLLKSGKYGKPITFSARRFSSFPNRISDVGVLFDLTIHDVDLINHIASNDVEFVFATGGKVKNTEFEDHVNLIIKFKNGIIGHCETNWLTPRKVREISITTTSHYMVLDLLNQRIDISSSKYVDFDPSNIYKTDIDFKFEKIEVNRKEPLKIELIDFLESCIEGRDPQVTGEQGFEAIKIIESGLKSINEGRLIRF